MDKSKKPTHNQNQKTLAVINSIHKAAAIFESKLIGKTFLYVYEGKSIEVVYRAKDFLHLTGADTTLSAYSFFQNAKAGKLSTGQVFFSTRHPYDLCKKKVNKLLDFELITKSPLFILEDITTQTHTFKFGLTELNFSVCLDPDKDFSGKLQSNYYIARSLRVEDSFTKATGAFEVNYIFSKDNDKSKYNQLLYIDKNKNISDLPENVLTKISADFK